MSQSHPITLTDRVRALTAGFMSRIGQVLHKAGIHPDMITIAGTVLIGIAAIVIARGELRIGGIILMVGLPFDALDGAVARAMQRKGRFGEMLDSTLDRYADGFIFAALSYYFAVQDDFNTVLLALVALLGTFMVSYTRARASGIGVEAKVGMFTRFERTVMILAMLMVTGLLIPGLWILAIGTHLTSIQRLWFVYKTLKQREIE